MITITDNTSPQAKKCTSEQWNGRSLEVTLPEGTTRHLTFVQSSPIWTFRLPGGVTLVKEWIPSVDRSVLHIKGEKHS